MINSNAPVLAGSADNLALSRVSTQRECWFLKTECG